MGRFWVDDLFIDKQARSLSVYAQVVFVGLCRFANRKVDTFVGYRRLALSLSISKNTVVKAVKELEASHLVVRLGKGRQGVSHLKKASVPPENIQRPITRDTRKGLRNYIKEPIDSVTLETLDRIKGNFTIGGKYIHR
jgi:hypothetical protein